MHSINIYLLDVRQLRSENIESLLNNGENILEKFLYKQLPKGLIALIPTDDDTLEMFFEENKLTVVNVETDYFGGSGDQSAFIAKYNGPESVDIDFHSSINSALKEYGVVKDDGMDEFDTIHLGRYRENSDFLK